ncbi:ABC transporter permease subunit, partial [Burkholderia multivorans]|uniref:ABC transporter permease subunit n=1 Tax=Burkholderia multivorans TaxID=87883 RepID=UPI001C65ED10
RDRRRRREGVEVVAQTWDINESWLILLGVSLWAGFPAVYGAALPHLYIPLIVMLFCLIVRGFSTELISHRHDTAEAWVRAFAVASLGAAIAQGVALAGLARELTLDAEGDFVGPTTPWDAASVLFTIVVVIGVGAAIVMTFLSTGLKNKRVLYATLTCAVIGALIYMPLQYLFYYQEMNWLWMFGLLVVAIGVAIGVGLAFRGPDPWDTARTTVFTTLIIAVTIFADRVLQGWSEYSRSPAINNRPIATIGASAPNVNGDFWITNLDSFTHLLLPSIALVLISFASYTRYTRGSMLEVMGQDYIRTARAKGLNERTVIMRHALRNALLPLASIIPVDVITMIGGAVITETIFGWNGMGKLFIDSMNRAELDPIMAYILITGLLAIIANLVADFLYAVLDPRIRVNA